MSITEFFLWKKLTHLSFLSAYIKKLCQALNCITNLFVDHFICNYLRVSDVLETEHRNRTRSPNSKCILSSATDSLFNGQYHKTSWFQIFLQTSFPSPRRHARKGSHFSISCRVNTSLRVDLGWFMTNLIVTNTLRIQDSVTNMYTEKSRLPGLFISCSFLTWGVIL